MNLGMFDHVMTLILVVALPIHAVLEHRRLQRKVSAGVPGARAQTYYLTLVVEWILVAAVLAFWLPGGRNLADLGLGFDVTLGWWIGAGATIVVIAVSIYQTFSTIRNSEALAKMREQVEPFRALLPHSTKEGQLFNAVSVTAGICEEFLYRGFLIAYFGAFVDIWLAVALSSIAFGVGHMYQGKVGILKTGVIGLALAGLYVLTGSLWAPMVLHAFVDVNSGFVGRKAMSHAAA
ncbi:MAG: type II CAAX endopeptidase family protein [Candidatus Krumholzibacteria bacterium]